MAGMVRGLLQINQLCDNCLVGKQRLSPFSVKEKYRGEHRLNLVDGDLWPDHTSHT
jgi:hypothetical protein